MAAKAAPAAPEATAAAASGSGPALAWSGWSGISRGRTRVKVEPRPGVDHNSTVPPWSAATCLTIDSPRPVPPVARERALSTR